MPWGLVVQVPKDLGSGLLGNCNFSYALSVQSIKGLGSGYREKLLGMGLLTCTTVDVMRDLEHHIRGPNMGTRSVLSVTNTTSEQTLLYLKLGKDDQYHGGS